MVWRKHWLVAQLPPQGRIGCFQSIAEAIRRTFFYILIFHAPLRHQDLAIGWELRVVRRMKIFKHLLRDPLEHRCGNLSALMQAYRRIQNDGNCNSRVVDRSKSGE